MIDVKRILCPTDFSEFSDWALELALPMARWFKSEISVIHVVPRVLMHPEYFPYMQEPVLPSPDVRKQAQEEIDLYAQRIRDAGIDTMACLEEGDSVEELLATAERWPADLIVMGTHGRRGFERLVLGSVTEKVLRKAPCPVMTVCCARKVDGVKEGIFKKILCPMDFSMPSLKALEFALSLAQESDAKLTLLHVVESFFDESRGISGSRSEVRARQEKDSLAKLRGAVPPEAQNWCEPEEVVLTGRPYQVILRVAEEQEADLIVMGVHGRSAVNLMLFGSTTHQVVRQTRCPVLVIRSG